MKSRTSGVSRRDFIRRTAQGAAALAAIPLAGKTDAQGEAGIKPSRSSDGLSRVVVVRDENAFHDNRFDSEVIQIMMDNGITRLTEVQDVGDAWKSLFSGITAASVIGIKINCLFPQHTHKEVTNAVLSGLKRMQVDGNPFPENNIIVWDKGDWDLQQRGYTINRSGSGVRYFGTTQYGETTYPIDSGNPQRLSGILTDQIHFLINLSVLKNHGTGVSLSMKNHYGSISNLGGDRMHNYPLATVLASLNALPPIREKQVICICDAIRAVVANGPDGVPTATPKRLILSRDTVAHDTIGAITLHDHGCQTTSLTGAARHISKAAEPPYSLGTCDPAQIELINVENPTAVENGTPAGPAPDDLILSRNYPNPFNSETVVVCRLEKQARVRIRIVNAEGRTVRRFEDRMEEPGAFQVFWDGKRADGAEVPSGTYILEMTAGRIRKSVKMQFIR